MPEHSPLPWIAWNEHGGKVMKSWRVGSQGKTDGIVTPVCVLDNSVPGYEEYANAQFIEKACNSHYELLEACESLMDAYAPRADESAASCGESSLHSSVRIARAAIAKAKGEQACS